MEQGNRIEAGYFELGHPGRRFFLRNRSKASSAMRRTRPMTRATADVRAPRERQLARERRIPLAGNVEARLRRRHFTDAILTHLLKPGHFAQQLGFCVFDEVAEQVHSIPFELPVSSVPDKFQAGASAATLMRAQPSTVSVIGQGNGGQSKCAARRRVPRVCTCRRKQFVCR